MRHLLHHLVASAAEATPDAPAVRHGERSLSYAELTQEASRLARLLTALGVRRGDRVGIQLEKSVAMVVAVYGVTMAGAAYVPLDSASPPHRLGYIAHDCGIETIVTATAMSGTWAPMAAEGAPIRHLVVLDATGSSTLPPSPSSTSAVDASALASFSPTPPAQCAIDRDLAYILYTSGSTGRPKGVMHSHSSALAFASWAATEFGLRAADRVSQIAPLVFDLSTFDLFATAWAGASVHLVDRQLTLFPLQLRRFLEERSISVMYAVPSVWTMLAERAKLEQGDLRALHTVLFAGEVFPSKYLSQLMRLLPHAAFANLYGPTETNVCTFHRVGEPPDPDAPPVSIGRAVANDEVIVVTDDNRIASPGEVGELVVRGATVMRGYWGDPDRTASTMIPSPPTTDPVPGGIADLAYRSGDLVREELDGTLTFLGRRDAQIKRMGYRIELGEIENAYLVQPEVLECAVTTRMDAATAVHVTAHIVLRDGAALDAVTRAGATQLPLYMLPDQFELLPQLPKTVSGKVDRVALRDRAPDADLPMSVPTTEEVS